MRLRRKEAHLVLAREMSGREVRVLSPNAGGVEEVRVERESRHGSDQTLARTVAFW